MAIEPKLKPEAADLGDFAEILLDDALGAASIQLPRIGAPPPRKIRLFKWGWNDTTKGRLKLTQRGAERAVAAFQKRGVAGAFDKWHSFFDKDVDPDDKTTQGNYILTMEGSEASGIGGLFADFCQFIADTAAEISAGKWPYVSPVPLSTKDGGEIVDVKNVSLVGLPATHNAQPLLMSLLSALPTTPTKEVPMSKQMKLSLSTGQHHMAALKQLADSGEPEHRELANSCLAVMGPHMQRLSQACGDNAGKFSKELAEEDEMSAKRLSLLSALETEFGTKDPEDIEGKILALQTKHSAAAKSERTAVLKLLSDNKDKVPSIRLEQLKGKSLAIVQSFLSELGDGAVAGADLPRGEQPERVPVAPTIKNTQADVEGGATHELKLSGLNGYQLDALSSIKKLRREQYGDKFNEAAVIAEYLSEVNVGRGK